MLVNLASVWGSVTAPYVSAYVVSKFGVRAFSESLREALRLEGDTDDIHVCTILPQSVDTPIFRHAANYTSRRAQPVPPVADPDRVVRAILRSVEHPRRQRTVGVSGRILEIGHCAFPGAYSRLAPAVMNWAAFNRDTAAPGPGNVFEPMPEWNQVEGRWRRTDVRAAVCGAAGCAAAAAAVFAARSRTS